jgi:conjugative relaxase-like TrwC/TraI family protein
VATRGDLRSCGTDVGVAVQAAHRTAVRAALDYLDTHAAFSRVGRNGHTRSAPTEWRPQSSTIAPRGREIRSCTHALVLNKLQCPDGEWRTIDGHEIYAHKKPAGVLYQAALRSELTRRLGVTWTGVSKDGQAEILGIPRSLVDRGRPAPIRSPPSARR